MQQGMSMIPRQQMGLQQHLAPRMIQSMEILQLSIMALQERLQTELQENPVLEIEQDTPEGAEAPAEAAEAEAEEAEPALAAEEEAPSKADDPATELVIDEGGNNEEDFDRLDALSRDWEDQFNEEHRPSRNGLEEAADRKHDVVQNMASRPQSLQDYLADQLSFLEVDPEEMKRLRFLISHVDNNGYLKASLEELAQSYSEPVTAAQMDEALRMVQKLDPPGVGARNLEECLRLQLTNETPHRDVVRVLIDHHLEDIQHNRLPVIQKRTGFDLHTIKEGIEVLKHLNPKPGAQFEDDNIPYVVPDIAIERDDEGGYEVRLLDDWTPNIYISRRYLELSRNKQIDAKDREYLKKKLQAANWLIDAIEQRRNTLMKVTKAIIEHQKAFLDKGPEHIHPLKMQQIADQVGVHVTTVSRAVDDKWVQTPRGIFPLKRFFGGGTETLGGEEVAWETIKNKLLEIIAHEDKANPLSDEDLVEKLKGAGYDVARRTVTKYRKMLKIASSRQRKVWTE
jgi:RNA polymerase sigma-54 factor